MSPKFYGGRTKTDIEKSLEAKIQQFKAGLAKAVNILRWIDAENGKVECVCDVSVGYYCQPCCIKQASLDPLGLAAYEEEKEKIEVFTEEHKGCFPLAPAKGALKAVSTLTQEKEALEKTLET